MLQREAINSSPINDVPPIVHEVLRSPGQPLDAARRAFMEPRFGYNFSNVRVHTDAKAAESARAVNALAYTVGKDVVFEREKYTPTRTGQQLLAHELTHVVQQEKTGQTFGSSLKIGRANEPSEIEAATAADRMLAGSAVGFVSPLSSLLLQRAPDKGSTEGEGNPKSPYDEEEQIIRYAIGALELGKLGKGMVLYIGKYWKAAAISESGFYVGPFTSDMGTFYYVYRFTKSDQKTNTYTLSRGTYLSGRDTKDLETNLAQVQGGKTLEFKTTGLIPPSGGAVPKAAKKDPGTATVGKTGGGDIGQPAGSEESEEMTLTPQRRTWLRAGRENMKHQIIALFNQIQKVKAARIDTWEKNANIKDPKPIKAALEVTVQVVGYGMGGVVGGYLTKAMAHGLAQEFAKEASLKSTAKLAEFLFKHAVEPAQEFLAEETKKALQESGNSNAVGALATKSSLLDSYVEAMKLQSISEEHVQTREFNATGDTKYAMDLALADAVIVFEKLYKTLFNQPNAFLRELSGGLIRLKDEMYVHKKAEDYGGDIDKELRKDDDIVETEPRSGNLLLVAPGLTSSIGPYHNPTFNFNGFIGLSSGVNNATLSELSGATVKDLPFTLGFRFWAQNPFYNPDRAWDVLLLRESLCQVWFTRRPDGTIWVDFDEPRSRYSGGFEWLASYYLLTSRELSKKEIRENAPNGALKVYEQIKNKPLIRASDFDIF
jgi:hypothetical protein